MKPTNGKQLTQADIHQAFVNRRVKYQNKQGVVIGVDPRPNPGCGSGTHYKEGNWLVVKLDAAKGRISETDYVLAEEAQLV